MSDSYPKQAKNWCDSYEIDLHDTSTLTQYEVTLTAGAGNIMWGSDSKSYTLRQSRTKGSRKDQFWYQVACAASTGVMDESCTSNWVSNVVWNIPAPS